MSTEQIVRLHVAYDGTNYHGWQRQPGAPTIEGSIMGALAQIWNVPVTEVEVQGASRTDSGVHALGQVVSFGVGVHKLKVWDYIRGLNALTPDTISINHAEFAPEGFNARHDSRGKIYHYRIWNHRFDHPLRLNRMWRVKNSLDLRAMNEAGQALIGEHDFNAFRTVHCQALTTVRAIHRIEVKQIGETEILIEVEGSAFLRNMVRIIAGTLVDVGEHKFEVDEMPDILASRDRARAGQTAPAEGLTLVQVHYPNHPWDDVPSVGMRRWY